MIVKPVSPESYINDNVPYNVRLSSPTSKAKAS